MVNNQSRRNFLRTASVAAAAVALPCTDKLLLASGTAPVTVAQSFRLFTADALAADAKKLDAAPGNEDLLDPTAIPLAIVMTTEKAKSAKEFEWHEGRDHIVQILDGTTIYEVGGTPQSPRNTKPGEWLAPASQDATKYTLHKGDMLLIPRGTPHKRSTEASVTFLLISSSGK